jgi:hypothetical protein
VDLSKLIKEFSEIILSCRWVHVFYNQV